MKLLIENTLRLMEKIYDSPVASMTASLEKKYLTCRVPKSFIKMTVRFGLPVAIAIVINRMRYRVKCHMLYNLDILKTLQINYSKLKAPKVVLWMIRRSMTSSFWRNLLFRIEMHYRSDLSGTFTKLRNSKRLEKDVLDTQLFNLYHQNF